MRRTGMAFVLSVFVSSAASAAQAAGPIFLQSHRAVYDLTLSRANEGAQVDSLQGRMVYEFAGSPCKGYRTRFRFVTRIENGDTSRLTDLQTSNYESGDGRTFQFANTTLVNSAKTQEVAGSAEVTGSATDVRLTKPAAKTLRLEPSQFPTTHMLEIIRRAEAGESFYQTTIFDGSDDADKVMATTVVIGKPELAEKAGAQPGDPEFLSGQPSWPVSIAYFDPAERGAGLPSFRTTFRLFANGITSDLVMDYGDFSVAGKLVDLKLLDTPKCPG